MRYALLVLRKELLELSRSPVLLLSIASLPLTLALTPVAALAYLVRAASPTSSRLIAELYGLDAAASPAAILVDAVRLQWLPLFLVMPVFLPILLAAQSVGGEKERRTLEPLLATPAPAWAIVLGKSVAAVLPAIAITWIGALVLWAGIGLASGEPAVPGDTWLFGLFVLAPLLSLLGNAVAVLVSVRLSDPRAAQNVAAMLVVPLVGLVVGQLAGKVLLSPTFYAGLAAAVAVADAALVVLAARVFDRERLLTR